MTKLRDQIVSKYKKAVDKAREALGAEIIIYYYTGDADTGSVVMDTINNEPLNPADISISNPTHRPYTTRTVNANTSWVGVNNNFLPLQLTAGEIGINDCYITCKLADVLLDPAAPEGKTVFDDAFKINIDGTFVRPKSTPLKYGLAGDRYSCGLICTKDSSLE